MSTVHTVSGYQFTPINAGPFGVSVAVRDRHRYLTTIPLSAMRECVAAMADEDKRRPVTLAGTVEGDE